MAKNVERIIEDSLKKVLKIEGATQDAFKKVINKFQKNLVQNISTLELSKLENVATAYERTAQTLTDSGYFKEVNTMLNPQRQAILATSFDQYKKLFNKAFRFQDKSLEMLQAMKEVDSIRFSTMGREAVDSITSQILEMQFDPTISKKRIRDSILESFSDGRIGKDLNVFANNVATEVRTRTAGFYSKANVQLAQDNGMTRFRYSGVIISTTRPFCEKHLNQIKTIAEWDALDNGAGQPDPVSIFRGGYNCRHTLSAVA